MDKESSTYKFLNNLIKMEIDKGKSLAELADVNSNYVKQLINNLQNINSDITIESWVEIVQYKIANDGDSQTEVIEEPHITPGANEHGFEVNNLKGSCWSAYKKQLINKHHFNEDAIDNIEISAKRILNRLSLNTQESGPIKGLVIGNVQSGKTANMAGLMAQAADAGWNLFIVLSGTIENLRIQTQSRLFNDLNGATNFSWSLLDNIKYSTNGNYNLDKLHLDDNHKTKYLMVCLKQSTRLNNLIKWLNKGRETRKNLKILIIDDEADQAGINTAKENNDEDINKERTKINKCIGHLLNDRKNFNDYNEPKAQCINYVAYTATPYANVLNEGPGPNSTFPEHFVASLANAPTYFGPQTIFGLEGSNYIPMGIVNILPEEEVHSVNKLESTDNLPDGLEEALLWFLCVFAIRKHNKVCKPVSFLVHTSQKQIVHEKLANMFRNWFKKIDSIKIIKKCEEVYNKQKNMLTLEQFKIRCRNYPYSSVKDYPEFKDFAEDLLEILNNGLKPIKIDNDGDPEFNKGVTLCIDNCKHKFVENNEHIRLLYPQDEDEVNFTTGYIVIGGATLSRGLTIEGLVSTYFLRTVNQADTLMQMGRWFGFRKGYELYPRIWLSDLTKDRFEYLSYIDYDLRETLSYMEKNNLSPALLGVKVKYHPSLSFLKLSGANKLKGARVASISFNGVSSQTTVFYDKEEIIQKNYDNTIKFIDSLPNNSTNLKNHLHTKNSLIFENVDNNQVLNYIKTMEYPDSPISINFDHFKDWYEHIAKGKKLKNWNVVIAGNEKESNILQTNKYQINRVNRSKFKQEVYDGKIRIGALRAAKDYYADVDISKLSEEYVIQVKNSNSKDYKTIRNLAGLDQTSLLIIYVIDKNSQPRENATNREALNLKTDLIGLTIVIPEIKNAADENYLKVKLKDEDIDSMDVIE